MLNAWSDVDLVTKFHATVVSIAVILAKGARLGDANASNALADTLVVLLPRNKVELKQRHTSGIIKCPAMSNESSRFSSASFFRSENGTCDPIYCQLRFLYALWPGHAEYSRDSE